MNNRPLVIDVECSGALRNNAHPFDPRNKLVLVGCYDGVDYRIYELDSNNSSISSINSVINSIREEINKYSTYIGFNFKFDLHWLSRFGITPEGRIWDCQLAEFILSRQTNSYPSLEEAARRFNLGSKNSFLTDWLSKGVDVDEMPRDGLIEYLKQDLKLTWDLYQAQKAPIRPYWPLFNVQCQDLRVLQQMEYNGLQYDLKASYQKTLDCIEKENGYKVLLRVLQPEEYINWGSTFHLSAVLYGGTIEEIIREEVGTYKSGNKVGTPRYTICIIEHLFPRLVEPKPNTALASGKHWSTAEDVLRELKATGKAKAIINAVIKLSEVEKLRSTYYEGIPEKFKKFNWEDGVMHGNLNQCMARTGRLSSSNPNLQNIPLEGKECFVSRFDDDE